MTGKQGHPGYAQASAEPRTCKGAPYQIFDHGFDLFLGHVYVLCGAFQGDLVLPLCELDVHLPQQNQEREGRSGTGSALSEPRVLCGGSGQSQLLYINACPQTPHNAEGGGWGTPITLF